MAQVSGKRGNQGIQLVVTMASRNQRMRVCPRCDLCGKAIRVLGVGTGEICAECISGSLPFGNIVSEANYRGALREFREGLGVSIRNFEGARFDPFGEEEREAMAGLNRTLRGCKYTRGEDVAGRQKEVGKALGCSLSLLFHNIRSAKGPSLELLEAEIRTWGVKWDIIGLAETWLDSVSEKFLSLTGYSPICSSRKEKAGGGVALLLRDGMTYRERPDLNVFKEGIFESIFVEIVGVGGGKSKIVGSVYRPPAGD